MAYIVAHPNADDDEREHAQNTIDGLKAYLRTTELWWREVDRDKIDPQGETPPWLTPALAEMERKQLTVPALAVVVQPTDGDGSYSVVAVDPLPGTPEEAIGWVKGF